MKLSAKCVLACFVSAIIASGGVSANEPPPGRPLSKYTTEELYQRVQGRQPGISVRDVLELGRRDDPRILPLLRQLAQELSAPPKPVVRVIGGQTVQWTCKDPVCLGIRKMSALGAKEAAARQGANEYFDEFVAGLSSRDGAHKIDCIDALAYIGDRAAVKHLIPLIDDLGVKALPSRDSAPPTYAGEAMDALKFLVPRKDFEKLGVEYPTSAQFRPWMKRWWLKNKARYGGLEFGQEKAFAEQK